MYKKIILLWKIGWILCEAKLWLGGNARLLLLMIRWLISEYEIWCNYDWNNIDFGWYFFDNNDNDDGTSNHDNWSFVNSTWFLPLSLQILLIYMLYFSLP